MAKTLQYHRNIMAITCWLPWVCHIVAMMRLQGTTHAIWSLPLVEASEPTALGCHHPSLHMVVNDTLPAASQGGTAVVDTLAATSIAESSWAQALMAGSCVESIGSLGNGMR